MTWYYYLSADGNFEVTWYYSFGANGNFEVTWYYYFSVNGNFEVIWYYYFSVNGNFEVIWYYNFSADGNLEVTWWYYFSADGNFEVTLATKATLYSSGTKIKQHVFSLKWIIVLHVKKEQIVQLLAFSNEFLFFIFYLFSYLFQYSSGTLWILKYRDYFLTIFQRHFVMNRFLRSSTFL